MCVMSGSACSDGSQCNAGGCSNGACGKIGQACCGNGIECTAPFVTCGGGGLAGGSFCRVCGGLGERCCPGAGNDFCSAPYACNPSGTCDTCGAPGQICCPGRLCKTGTCTNDRCL
jgi:hypothetical protein